MTHSDRALKSVVRVLLTSAVLIVSLQLAVEKNEIIPGGEEVEVQKRSLSVKCKTTGHDLRETHFLKMKPRLPLAINVRH